MPYSADTSKLFAAGDTLLQILEDSKVPEQIAKWLGDKGIVKVGAFADLAEDKNGICEVISAAIGIEFADNVERQPLKTAWREADAKHQVNLQSRAKGEDPEKETPIGVEERNRWMRRSRHTTGSPGQHTYSQGIS